MERDHLEDQAWMGRIKIKMYLQEVGWGAWTEFIWLRTGTGGRHL